MKLLMLDIDWPLIRFTSNSNNFDKNLLENLKEILDKTWVQIVISSDWRYEKPLLDWLFKRHNLSYIDTTIINEEKVSSLSIKLAELRSSEIKEFLGDYKKRWIYIEKYVVVDDLQLDIEHFYKIDKNVGLNKEITNKIIDYLNN